MPTIAPYGTWESPITAEQIAAKSVTFQDIVGDQDCFYWTEARPSEEGRYAIVKCDFAGNKTDVLPLPFSARTRLHEYGGRSFTVANGVIYFVNYKDQNLYKIIPGTAPQQLTSDGIRFAELIYTKHGLVAIAEEHSKDGKEVQNYLALINPKTGSITELASGYDFYSSPAISESGKIAWISWNHPNMPWNDTHLWIADLIPGELINQRQVLKNYPGQAYFQPQWDEHDNLYFVSDIDNWWNLYLLDDVRNNIKPIYNMQAEFGVPLWRVGASCWKFYQNQIVCSYIKDGQAYLALINYRTPNAPGALRNIPTPYSDFARLCVLQDKIAFIGSSPSKGSSIVMCTLNEHSVLATSSNATINANYISIAKHIKFDTPSRQEVAYAYFYQPKNPEFSAPAGEKPPVIIFIHGGPTGMTSGCLKAEIQFWTSRGFAVADVNYGGSCGYGRKYRLALERNDEYGPGYWGEIDINDCVACVQHLASIDAIDPNKALIRGRSAGGYTTLAALAFTKVFASGTSYYGVSDIELLAHETHKFESRYMDRLIGKLPEFKSVYDARSPIKHLNKFTAPLLVLQGDDDKIVLPNQAELLVSALRAKGVRVDYKLYAGEQHGFNKEETLVDALNRELAFYLSVIYPSVDVTEKKTKAAGLTAFMG